MSCRPRPYFTPLKEMSKSWWGRPCGQLPGRDGGGKSLLEVICVRKGSSSMGGRFWCCQLELETFLDPDEDEDNNSRHIFSSKKKTCWIQHNQCTPPSFQCRARSICGVFLFLLGLTNDYVCVLRPWQGWPHNGSIIILIVQKTVVEFIILRTTLLVCIVA